MLNDELALSQLEVLVVGNQVQSLGKGLISSGRVSMSSGTGIVQGGKHTRLRSLQFDQVTDNFVVEVFDRSPLDLFTDIFVLLGFQSQLDENLLQFLVDIVDTQLLERIVLKDLKPVDIQDPNGLGAGGLHDVQRNVVHRPTSHPVVSLHDPLGDGVDQSLRVHLQQISNEVSHRCVLNRSVPFFVLDKGDVPDPKNGSQDPEDLVLLQFVNPNSLHSLQSVVEIFDVIDPINGDTTGFTSVLVHLWLLDPELLTVLLTGTLGELTGSNASLKLISKYFPCLDELLFLSVLAHPKDSKSGFVASTMSLMYWICPEDCSDPETEEIYCMILLAASVFPAPDSPEIMTHWDSL
ncbi:hypothetical protein WICPIJ_004350 [Wickerhamomyces pijperi]|uniref:Uncharacterized protein n=1 Tax=Wickerhamomyces pijperi TaxID=599730 RepID=A0A9P8Q847_WICPI|nr:hypothetical protein WICPIJ_004350 [Wickerhamomyces pijperi]